MPVKPIYFILAFVVILSVLYYFIYNDADATHTHYKNNQLSALTRDYKVIYKAHKDKADLLFKTLIQEKKIIELFKNRERDKLRKELLNRYLTLRVFDIRQLHFHLPNNDSFLRMHRPNKYGDNLSKVRLTVKYVNENLKPIDGFEEGRIFNGFRFVYPLFDNKEHIGSVEISFSALAFLKKIVDSYDVVSGFYVHKDVVNTKVFQDEKSNYQLSPLPNYLYQKSVIKRFPIAQEHQREIKKFSKEIEKGIQRGKPFSIYNEDSQELITFIPMQNPITHNVVSAFSFHSHDPYIYQDMQKTNILFAIAIIITFTTLMLLYKELLYKKSLEKAVKSKTKTINETLQLLNNVIKGSNLGYWDYIITQNKLVVDKRWREMIGLSKQDKIDKLEDWSQRVHPDDLQRVMTIINNAIENHQPYNIEFRMQHKDGHYIWIQSLGCVVEGDNEADFLRMSGTHADISERKAFEETILQQKQLLEHQSQHDALTGVRNRRTLEKDIKTILTNYTLHNSPFALLMLDIDWFKKVNDTYGHDVGDRVLRETAQILTSSVRESDRIYRAGGEEFLILFSRVSHDKIVQIAEKIRLLVKEHKFLAEDASFYITVSGGLYHSSLKEINSVNGLLALVDKALYASKETGRNKITNT